ncbi:hypothetical protein [Cyclobacterium sp.]|uniref:hypothetical protein n=1 Tax=Cyclobacterium sp. TaxID=1966343 RepID=UPI0019CA2AB9|nr:hypothetical protein [Cyclobacterium sp.]MBD3629277.1 hypothetical protein [Cyclobacterium sp.]
MLKKDFGYIGLRFVNVKKDILTGLIFGTSWTILQFALLIPGPGGINRSDINASSRFLI